MQNMSGAKALAILIVFTTPVGCADTTSPLPIVEIQLSASADTVEVGDIITLGATLLDSQGNLETSSSRVDWVSGDTRVARVDGGVVTAVGSGVTVIVAQA